MKIHTPSRPRSPGQHADFPENEGISGHFVSTRLLTLEESPDSLFIPALTSLSNPTRSTEPSKATRPFSDPKDFLVSSARQLLSVRAACTRSSGDCAPGPGTALAHPALPRDPRGQGFGWASAIRPRLHPRAPITARGHTPSPAGPWHPGRSALRHPPSPLTTAV